MRISFVVPSGAFIFGVIGSITAFTWANKLLGDSHAYETEIIAANGSINISGATGTQLVASRILDNASMPIDTLIVTGSLDLETITSNQKLVAWVAKHAPSVRRCGSVCTGAFVLAAAGLLDGLRVTSHVEFTKTLAERFPALHVETGPMFIHEKKIWTSAGMTAGIDMAIAMIEEDHGRKLALAVARQMNFHLRHSESEVPYIAQMSMHGAGRAAIQEILIWVREHISSDLSVKSLADHARMSVRNFTRVFQAECSITPARFVDTVRVDAARKMLETTRLPLKRVATACGFVTIGRMRRAFRRHLGTTPQDYRLQLQSQLAEREQIAAAQKA